MKQHIWFVIGMLALTVACQGDKKPEKTAQKPEVQVMGVVKKTSMSAMPQQAKLPVKCVERKYKEKTSSICSKLLTEFAKSWGHIPYVVRTKKNKLKKQDKTLQQVCQAKSCPHKCYKKKLFDSMQFAFRRKDFGALMEAVKGGYALFRILPEGSSMAWTGVAGFLNSLWALPCDTDKRHHQAQKCKAWERTISAFLKQVMASTCKFPKKLIETQHSFSKRLAMHLPRKSLKKRK